MFRFISFLLLSIPSLLFAQARGIDAQMTENTSKPFSGNTYAVIVGIDKYQSPNLSKLKYAVSDARAFEEFLHSKAGGEVPKENIRMFINDSATTGRFKKLGLSWVKNVAKRGDRVYLYFSGHGLTVSGTDSYFLANNLASDFDIVNIEEAGTQPLYMLKVNTIRPLHDSGVQVMLIMDACRSHLEKTFKSDVVTSFNPNMKSAEMKVGDYMFISASNGQVSSETQKDNINHGIFTYYLLSGLYGMADKGRFADGNITFNKLKNYVTQKVSEYTNENQIPIIEKTDEANPTLAIVDSQLLARQINMEQGALDNSMAMNTNKFSGNKSANSLRFAQQDTTGTYTHFLQAIQDGKLWGEQGAIQYFDELEKRVSDQNIIQDAVLNLSALLLDSGQMIINAYLAFDKNNLKKIGVQNDLDKSLDSVFAKGAAIFKILHDQNNKYYPEDPDLKTYLQNYYFMMGRSLLHDELKVNTCKKYLKDAYQIDTNNLYILHARNLAGDFEGIEEAIRNEEKVYKKYPRWSNAMNVLAKLYEVQKKQDSCIKYYELGVKFGSDNAENWRNLANAYADIHRYDLASGIYDSTLFYAEKDISTGFNLGKLYELKAEVYDKINKVDSALHYYQLATNLSKNDFFIWHNYGNLFYRMGLYDSAKNSFKKTMYVLRPNEMNGKITRANCYIKLGQYDSARISLKYAVISDPTNEFIWKKYGEFFLELKKWDSARYCIRKIKSDTAMYWLEMGKYHSKQFNADSAFYYLESALTKSLMNDRENEDFFEMINEWFNACNTSSQSFSWVSDQMSRLFDILKKYELKNASIWSRFIKGFELTQNKKIEEAYQIMDSNLEKEMQFNATEAGCWYSKAKFYQENMLSEEKIVQFLEKAVALNPSVCNGAAKMELMKLNKSAIKKKTDRENKSSNAKDDKMFPTINISDKMGGAPIHGFQMW